MSPERLPVFSRADFGLESDIFGMAETVPAILMSKSKMEHQVWRAWISSVAVLLTRYGER